MDLDPGSWGELELGLKIGPVKTSTGVASATITGGVPDVSYKARLLGHANKGCWIICRLTPSQYIDII